MSYDKSTRQKNIVHILLRLRHAPKSIFDVQHNDTFTNFGIRGLFRRFTYIACFNNRPFISQAIRTRNLREEREEMRRKNNAAFNRFETKLHRVKFRRNPKANKKKHGVTKTFCQMNVCDLNISLK